LAAKLHIISDSAKKEYGKFATACYKLLRSVYGVRLYSYNLYEHIQRDTQPLSRNVTAARRNNLKIA